MSRLVMTAIVVVFAAVIANAQQKVYKWVDEDGVVHFSETPPTDSSEAETITTAPAPASPGVQQAVAPQTSQDAHSTGTAAAPDSAAVPVAPAAAAGTDITSMSLAELDQRCDAAREEQIAPLRDAEIQKCKQDRRNDPNYCETFHADYGDGGRTATGAMRPRMFDDIPECVDAMNERNRRPR